MNAATFTPSGNESSAFTYSAGPLQVLASLTAS